MDIKVLMTWNIKPGREQEYFGFAVGEFLPKANKMGLDLTDAWVTVYGDQPQILVGAMMPDLKTARELLDSQAWFDLRTQLEDFVDNFTYKLVQAKGNFQF